ncbi:unnamed protein product [Clonostachys solani]|uniref:Gfd2/YDR514C-like C-terminal domain-containing protein n=1 Tax=Clonostachys solani TaxID=160281 RepID=A0A9N9Z4Y3_9HYPO|nr:unnamed protein product [Clonostachys solani]
MDGIISECAISFRTGKLVAVDIDSLQEDKNTVYQAHIGISIIDAQSLLHPSLDNLAAIESHHLVVGSPKFERIKANRFLFGDWENIPRPAIKQHINEILQGPETTLVFHEGGREISVLERLDIQLSQYRVIDTTTLVRSPVPPRYKYSLEALLQELGIPFANLHSAGNDAHFILRALLMLAVRYAEGQQEANLPDWAHPDLVQTAREISQAPRPLTKAEKMETPEAKRKLRKKMNKKKKRGGVPAAVAEEARGEAPGANTP